MNQQSNQPSKGMKTFVSGVIAIVFMLIVVGAFVLFAPLMNKDSNADESATPSATPEVAETVNTDVANSATDAASVLETLTIKGRGPATGYSADAFNWNTKDVDRNGCKTRDDILTRDLTNVTYKSDDNCVVQTGTLDDPYTGMTIDFVRATGDGKDGGIQIDHVVARKDAWQKGASSWTADQLTAFGNDPLNLLAVQDRANSQKGDGDAATWLPSNKDFRCEYVARQIAVKSKYALSVTQAEHDAMSNVLSACPGQEIPA